MPRTRTSSVGSAVSAIPTAIGLATALASNGGLTGGTVAPSAPKAVVRSATAAKHFSVPMTNLQQWSRTVLVTLPDVSISGHSNVHALDSDCEIHLGAQTSAFDGTPNGLVLEPMNACVQPFPGDPAQDNASWVNFAQALTDFSTKGGTATATGVPRIWPEHLIGGGPSNPDHAVELHPLAHIEWTDGATKHVEDFVANIFAGEYGGGVKEETALGIIQNTSVTVTKNGDSADIAFTAGTIGNFTVITVSIDKASMVADSDGSVRMNGTVNTQGSTLAPVRLVTVKGSRINDSITTARADANGQVTLDALVLFSLSPESVLAAANKSTGNPVKVDKPIQLILYGTPDDQ
jgi:hypothetical protein